MSVERLINSSTGKISDAFLPNRSLNTTVFSPYLGTNTVSVAGNIGETIQINIPFANKINVVAGPVQTFEAFKITLTPGKWIVYGNAYVENTGANLGPVVYGLTTFKNKLEGSYSVYYIQNNPVPAPLALDALSGPTTPFFYNTNRSINVYMAVQSLNNPCVICGNILAMRIA